MNNWTITFSTISAICLLATIASLCSFNNWAIVFGILTSISSILSIIFMDFISKMDRLAKEINETHFIFENIGYKPVSECQLFLRIKLEGYNIDIIEAKLSFLKNGEWSIYYGSNILECETFK